MTDDADQVSSAAADAAATLDGLCPWWPEKYGIRCAEHGNGTWSLPNGGTYFGSRKEYEAYLVEFYPRVHGSDRP